MTGFWSCVQGDKPKSHLSYSFFISKRYEKVVARRIEDHLEYNDLNDSYQSAYRRCHTETTLLNVHSDSAEALDEGSMTALIMLNVSAAFSVIDHPLLLKCIEYSFGMEEKGLYLGKVVPRRQNSVCFSGG